MFSDRLRQLRKQHKISQDALAKQLFVSQQSIAKWEKGKITPNPETIVKIANIFDVSTDYLLGHSDIFKIDEEEPTQEEWDSLTDTQKLIIELMGKLTPEQQDEIVRHAQYRLWLLLQKDSEQ